MKRPLTLSGCPQLRLCAAAALLALLPCLASAQQVSLQALGEPGRYTGFTVSCQDGGQAKEAARVLLQAGQRWTAARLQRRREGDREVLELRDLDTSGTGGTPTLGPGSFVRLSAGPAERFPRLDFRLEINAFQRPRWNQALGQTAPLAFLALPLSTARVWYVHGLLCPTPRWDPYPLTRPTIRGSWAEGWSYGAALGALTVPAMALWDDQAGRMVGYEWAEARLTDKSDKYLGISYCAGLPGSTVQFLTLLSTAQRQGTELTDPALPTVAQSHLRVVYSLALPPTSDVNRLLLQHFYADYRPLLPTVPAMNDLSWMVSRRLEELGGVGPSGGAFLGEVPKTGWGWNQFFYDPGSVLFGGGFRGVDQMYKQHKAEAIARFDKDLAETLPHVRWLQAGDERCCTWRFPLTGSWNQNMGGEAACTDHHVAAFGLGASMLASYANTGRPDLLPYIDGLYNWARHYVFTRGDIADIPESMFTLQISNLALEFLMNYRQVFAAGPDAERRRRAREALDLAHMVVYRNANVTIGDSDETDELSGAFMMPGNMAKFWLGQISNAELCDPFRAMIILHVETGDPVFKWLVRGALERWWIGFKEDCWHTSENIDIWGDQTGEKGMQTGIHDPCDSFWEWAEPVGDALLRATCGAKAALAFCRGTRSLDVADYTFRAPRSFRFAVRRVAEGPVPEPFSIILSSPWRDLGGLPVRVNGAPLAPDRVRVLGTYHEHLYLTGIRVGDRIEVGDVGDAPTLAPVEVPVAGGARSVPREALTVSGRRFELAALPGGSAASLRSDWSDPANWAGLPVGLQYAHGVPYLVEPRALGPGCSLPVHGREVYVLGAISEPGGVRVVTGGKEQPLTPDQGVLAARGWPMCEWKLWVYPVKLEGGVGRLEVVKGGLVLGVTTLQEGPGLCQELARLAASRAAAGSAAGKPPWADLAQEARRRLQAAGGPQRAPVAFIPPVGATYAFLAEWADRLGLTAVPLTPEELVTPGLLTPARFPLAVYTGEEEYLRTVREKGDAERALMSYLRAGGTFLVAGRCRPFTYARDLTEPEPKATAPPSAWALLGNQFELFLLGPGEAAPDAVGFETLPPGGPLTLRREPGQAVLWDCPEKAPFPTSDVRYRPLTRRGVDPQDEVLPLLTAVGADGKSYGAAAALVRHHCREFNGAQVLWAWGTLLLPGCELRDQLAAELLTHAVVNAPAAREPLPGGLALAPPKGQSAVAVLPPDCDGRDEIIRQACAAHGKQAVFLSPAQFVSAGYFSPAHFPMAIQAVEGERFIQTYRTPGDGEEAYKRYLRQGGTLVVCQNATPFWYEMLWEKGQWTQREPQRFWSMAFELGFETAYGFERPDQPMRLELTEEGRKLWPGLPARMDLAGLGDQRWRSLTPYRSSAAREFIPLARVLAPDGTPYPGLAAAMIRFRDSDYRGARVIYLWGNLAHGELGEKLLDGCLGG